MSPIKPGKYKHYKGTFATVLGVAQHSETKEKLVVYYHKESETGTDKLWVRPLAMFLENVNVNGKSIPRFTCIEENNYN